MCAGVCTLAQVNVCGPKPGELDGTIWSAEASGPPTGRRLAEGAGQGPFSGPEWCRDLAKATQHTSGRTSARIQVSHRNCPAGSEGQEGDRKVLPATSTGSGPPEGVKP